MYGSTLLWTNQSVAYMCMLDTTRKFCPHHCFSRLQVMRLETESILYYLRKSNVISSLIPEMKTLVCDGYKW